MEARIKGTNEIYEVMDLFDDGTALLSDGSYIKVSKLKFIKQKYDVFIDWEKRRYEIAKDVVSNQIVACVLDKSGYDEYSVAAAAIKLADELIKQLQNNKEEKK